MQYKKKHRPVLHGHKKVRNTFYPPFLLKSKELGIDVHAIEWRKNLLPELFWLAPLVQEHGFQRACILAGELCNCVGEVAKRNTFFHAGTVSWFAKLTNSQKHEICRGLQESGALDDIRKSVDPIAKLYPKFPLKFLLDSGKTTTNRKEAMESIAPLLWECLYRDERLPTLIQGVLHSVTLASGRMHIAEGLNVPLPQELEDYPKSDESLRAASFIRCIVGQMEAMPTDSTWPQYFWQHGNTLGGCQIPPEPGIPVGGFSQAFIMYHLECFRQYNVETSSIWEIVNKRRTLSLYSQLKDEIILGLAARVYRLAIQISSFIPNWVEDVGQVYVRMAVESYIYWVWFRECASDEDFRKFYEYGLGQQKLASEHIRAVLEQEGLSQEEIEEGNSGLDFLRRHKMPELIPVNVGNAFGKDLRAIAKEAGLGEIYSLVFCPTSSMVHGSYDALEQFYLRVCRNPFHCLHRIPYFWSKNSVSEYGPSNTLVLADWILAEMLKEVGETPPIPMPGSRFIDRLNDDQEFEEFCEDPAEAPDIASNEEFVSELRAELTRNSSCSEKRTPPKSD